MTSIAEISELCDTTVSSSNFSGCLSMPTALINAGSTHLSSNCMNGCCPRKEQRSVFEMQIKAEDQPSCDNGTLNRQPLHNSIMQAVRLSTLLTAPRQTSVVTDARSCVLTADNGDMEEKETTTMEVAAMRGLRLKFSQMRENNQPPSVMHDFQHVMHYRWWLVIFGSRKTSQQLYTCRTGGYRRRKDCQTRNVVILPR